MTSVQNSSAATGVIGQYLPPPPPPDGVAQTRLDSLLTLAGDRNASPVARGEALAEADVLMGGRAEAWLAQMSNPVELASARAAVGPTRVELSSVNLASGRMQGVVQQLRYEAGLNRGADPTYAAQLDAYATRLERNPSLVPDGSYRQIMVQPPLDLTDRGNPIGIPRLQNPAASLQRIDGEIAGLNAQIQSIEANRQSNPRAAAQGIAILNQQINALRDERTANVDAGRLGPSSALNGTAFRAAANGTDPNATPVIFVNGVNTDALRSFTQAMELSDTLGVPVEHVVNVSSRQGLVEVGLAAAARTGLLRSLNPNEIDLRIQQHATGNPPAAETTANLILQQLATTDGKVKIVGYSQGAAIGTEALRMVHSALQANGVTGDALRQELGRIEFLGIGPGAAERHLTWSYDQASFGGPAITRRLPELSAVDYNTISDVNDPIARLLNVTDRSTRTGQAPSGGWANPVESGQAVRQMQEPGGILPHLSYFQSYALTDPGAVYNRAATTQLHRWFAGFDIGNQVIDMSNMPRPFGGSR